MEENGNPMGAGKEESKWVSVVTGYYDGPMHGVILFSRENVWRYTVVGHGLRLPRMYCLRLLNQRQARKWFDRVLGHETTEVATRMILGSDHDWYQGHEEGLPIQILPKDILAVSDDIQMLQGRGQHADQLLQSPQTTHDFDRHSFQAIYSYLLVSPDSYDGLELPLRWIGEGERQNER